MEEPKQRWYSRLPKWLKIFLLIVSIVTLVYWLCFAVYRLLSGLRVIGAFIFEERNYWTFLTCIAILGVGSLLMAQFVFGLDPFGKAADWFTSLLANIREAIAGVIA